MANVLVIFKPDQFEHVVPYLMLHRDGLDVLVHPLTEDAVEDHTDFAMWLGKPVELKIHTLPHGRGGPLASCVSALFRAYKATSAFARAACDALAALPSAGRLT